MRYNIPSTTIAGWPLFVSVCVTAMTDTKQLNVLLSSYIRARKYSSPYVLKPEQSSLRINVLLVTCISYILPVFICIWICGNGVSILIMVYKQTKNAQKGKENLRKGNFKFYLVCADVLRPRIYFPFLQLISKKYFWCTVTINTTGATSEAETAYPSGAPEFTPGFKWGSCYSIFSFICMFCRSLFVPLYFFFWPLCCLFFFDIRFLITSLWYLQTLLTLDYYFMIWKKIIRKFRLKNWSNTLCK